MDNKQNPDKLTAFRMYKNLYFIGNEQVSVHLIDTEEGLIIIDTGYPSMKQLILDNIEKMGFDPKSICAIFHSHGHIDHFGNTEYLKEISGAKTYISRIDNDILNGKRDLSWAKELGRQPLPFFDCDVLLEDGDSFDFGTTTVRCIHTPGHTEGVMSFIITLRHDGKEVVAAMHGGIGSNSMKADYLESNGLPLTLRDSFREGLRRLAEERVDLVLGNHPEQSKTLLKQKTVLSGNELTLDPREWHDFLAYAERRLDALLESEKQ